MLQAVQKGLGIAVVPLHVLKRSYYKDKVNVLESFQVDNGRFYVVYHKDSLELTRIKTTLERLTSSQNPFGI